MRRPRLAQNLILFRCDGTTETGLGHVSRCLGFAEALREGGIGCRFLGRFEAGAADLLHSAGVSYERSVGETGGREDACRTLRAFRHHGARAVVVDSYQVDAEYVASLERRGAPLLLIDDFGRLQAYECSALLNFTVNAARLDYPGGKQRYFLGPEYLLVRRALRLLRRKTEPRTRDVQRVLVAIGGVDSHDLSRFVVKALLEVAPRLSVHVLVGRSYEYVSELSSLIAEFRGESQVWIQSADPAAEFAWSDMCICGGGLTKYEAAYLGVPSAVLSQNLEQARETVHFANEGLALDLGLWNHNDHTTLKTRLAEFIDNGGLRESLSQAGLACFPEDPTRRAAEAFAEFLESASVQT